MSRDVLLYLLYDLPEGNLDHYAEMLRLSLSSFDQNLAGRWDVQILEGQYRDMPHLAAVNQMYRDLFASLRRLHRQSCNVLFCDQDTLCVRPTAIFGALHQMSLFWHTDPPHGHGFRPYLNAGVVYLPADMEEALWTVLEVKMATIPNLLMEYDDSQKLFNAMFYSQVPTPILRPELNWSPRVPNPVAREDARIIHFHSTRGSGEVLELMRAWK